MEHSEEALGGQRASVFVPVELQERGFLKNPIFRELNRRAYVRAHGGIRLAQPWIRWQGFSAYLDCIAYADRAARALPTGRGLTLSHVTPGRLYSVSSVFLAQALADNLAVWLCHALPLPVGGEDRRFHSRRFQEELIRKAPGAGALLERHAGFLAEIESYRQAWAHTMAGGALPFSDLGERESPDPTSMMLGVPADPSLELPGEEPEGVGVSSERYPLGEFTARVFDGAAGFFLTWLRFALDHVHVAGKGAGH